MKTLIFNGSPKRELGDTMLDVVTKPRLELVKKAGKQYAETGTINAELLAEIDSPMIPKDMYAAIANGEH